LAEHFQAKVAFPAEATAGLADEQYMRNVVDVLYRTETKRPRDAGRPRAEAPLAEERATPITPFL
jgi:hypothetical protein